MGKQIVGLTKAVLPWSAKQLTKMMDNGTAIFSNACQRGLVWDLPRKSMLIHSLITNMPIPAFYAARGADKRYDFLDGKQRSNAIHDFIKGVYALKDVPPVLYDDGSEVDVNGLYFSSLPEDMQDNILSYSLNINYFDDISEEEQEEMFYRLNSGKSLTSIELSRVKCHALPTVQVLGHHPVFDFLSDKARARYADEDLVVKCFAMLDMDEPCLDTKAVRPFMEQLEINKAKHDKMYKIFDTIKKMHDELEADGASAVAKRLYVKTHFISIIPFVAEHGKQTEFIKKFFSGERMSISQKYNDNATAGVGHAPSVKARLDAIETEWRKFK